MKAFVLSIFTVFGLFTLVFSPVFAQENTNQERVERIVLQQSEVNNGDYLVASEEVILSGIVNGDAYIAGGNVLIDGTVNGDLLVAGGNVTVTGRVTDNIRVIGGNVTVSGDVGRSVTAVGGTITVTNAANIEGSFVAAGGNIQVFAPIGRDAHFAGGNVLLGNTIGSNVGVAAGQLTVASTARITGDLLYMSNQPASIQQGATITGRVTQKQSTKTPQEQQKDIAEGATKALTGISILGTLGSLLVGLLLVWLLPNYVLKTSDVIQQRPFLSLGVGFLAIFLTPILLILLFVSLIGIPLALLLFATYLIILYLSGIFVSLAIGQWVVRVINKPANMFLTFFVGFIVYTVLTWIPFLGGIVSFFGMLIGVGAFLIMKRGLLQELRGKKFV